MTVAWPSPDVTWISSGYADRIGSLRGSQCSLRTNVPPLPTVHGSLRRYGPLDMTAYDALSDLVSADALRGANSGSATM
jgi:hypothetical protein